MIAMCSCFVQHSFCLLAASMCEDGTSVPSTAEISEAFGPDAARQSCLSNCTASTLLV